MKRSENFLYLLIWLIVGLIPVFILRGNDNFSWSRLVIEWFRVLPFLLVFFVNNSLLVPRLLFRRKTLLYLAFISMSIVGIALLFEYLKPFLDYLSPNAPPPPQPPPFGNHPNAVLPPWPDRPAPYGYGLGNPQIWRQLVEQMLISFLVVGFNTAIKFVFKQQEDDQNNEKQQKMYLQSELSFLRQQISPHFFMNTLNNIHALVDLNSQEAKEAIIKLSQLMGYMLYESQSEKISVQKEMAFIKNFVELMRIRFTEDVNIDLDIPEELPSVSIPPLLTISFIENAFKHGISYEDYSFVHISFRFSEDKMNFEIKNSTHVEKVKSNNSGIGNLNARNRLNLIYGSSYELSIDQLPEKIFTVKLTIPL
ncbi:MAG: histidine kinase [Bacteroidales bacterium]|nr:histidine kinase [Bacteroidales bacterium]